MATTTNYSWTTPDDTALVKDGAAAIRSLGTAIDTTVFNNAGAAIAKTIVDAKGDLIAATAADTVARLASSGTNGDLLTVDTSTATGLKWATPAGSSQSFSLLNAGGTDLTGATSITVSGISGKNQLLVYIQGVGAANASSFIGFQINGDSGANYNAKGWTAKQEAAYGASVFGAADTDSFTEQYLFRLANNAGITGMAAITIFGCNSSGIKTYISDAGSVASYTGQIQYSQQGFYTGTSTVSSITIKSSTGNLNAGKVYIYGSA